jgi:hypothetical protein
MDDETFYLSHGREDTSKIGIFKRIYMLTTYLIYNPCVIDYFLV